MSAHGTSHRPSPLIYLDEKSPNFSVEAVFKQVDIKSVPVQVDLFKLVDVDVDTVVFHEHG